MMKSRVQKLIAVEAVLIILVWLFLYNYYNQTWQKFVANHPAKIISDEPKYDGQTLTHWMQYWSVMYGNREVERSESKAALHQIGTNAIPYFVKWIGMPPKDGLNFNHPRHALQGFKFLGPVAKPAIPDLIKMVGRNQDYPMRALQHIGRDAVPALAEKLLETLADTNKPIMNWRDPGYQTNVFHVQECVVQILNEMGTNAEPAVPSLIKCLNSTSSWFRAEAASALTSVGRNQPDIIIPVLMDAVTNSNLFVSNQVRGIWSRGSGSVQSSIAGALGSIGSCRSEVVIPFLINVLTNCDAKTADRGGVVGALAQVGRDQPDVVVPVLIFAFTNSTIQVQIGIADALATFGSDSQSAVPFLILAGQSEDWRLRAHSAIALKKIAPQMPGALAPLIKNLGDQNMQIREDAIGTLGDLNTNAMEALPALIVCLQDANTGVQQRAIWAVEKYGTNAVSALPALAKCLRSPDWSRREEAESCLATINAFSDEIIIALGENLSHTNAFVSGGAESTLGKFANRSKLAFVTLIKKGILGAVSRDDRNSAKSYLIDVSRDDPKFMLECLNDANAQVRSGALMVFYDLARRVPESIEKLRELAANDPDSHVRSRAADVLRLQLQ